MSNSISVTTSVRNLAIDCGAYIRSAEETQDFKYKDNKMAELKVNWTTIRFRNFEINRIPDSLEGNYVIWSADFITYKSQTNYVGKGKIKSKLNYHLKYPEISNSSYTSQIYASYISVSKTHQAGVENFLAHTLKPRVKEEWSTKPQFWVILPWGKREDHYIYLLEIIKQSESIQNWVEKGYMTTEQAMDYIERVILPTPVYRIGRN